MERNTNTLTFRSPALKNLNIESINQINDIIHIEKFSGRF